MSPLKVSCALAFVANLVLCGCSSTPKTASNYLRVEAEGKGSSCAQALNLAKIAAADKAAGSFVHGQRTLIDDTIYSEWVTEYSGAIVNDYKILSSVGNSPCVVRIDAEVVLDKKNTAIALNSKSIKVDDVTRIAEKQRYSRAFMASLIRQPSMFNVKVDNLTVHAEREGIVDVEFDIVSVNPSPKWYSDIQAYLTVNAAHDLFRAESSGSKLAKGFWSLASLGAMIVAPYAGAAMALSQGAVTKKFKPVEDAGLCLSSKKSELNCYRSDQQIHIIQVLNEAYLEVVTAKDGRAYSRFPVPASGFSLLEYASYQEPLITDTGLAGTQFLVIKPSQLPQKVHLRYPQANLPAGGNIEVRMAFKVGRL